MDNKIKKIKPKIIPILKKYQIGRASLFGSIVSGDFRKQSDIDILVELPKNVHGFDYIGLRLNLTEELEKILERKVDLVEFDLIKPSLEKYIVKNQVPLW